MTKVVAAITTSVDGYITGPRDGPTHGLGDGGERLHYWVFGGPWSYEAEPRGEATGAGTRSTSRGRWLALVPLSWVAGCTRPRTRGVATARSVCPSSS